MSEIGNLEFTIDLNSLERTLAKAQEMISNVFSPVAIGNFDNRVLDLNKDIQILRNNMEKLGLSAQAVEGFADLQQQIGRTAEKIQQGNTALIQFSDSAAKARNEFAGMMGAPAFANQQVTGKLLYNRAGLSRLGPLNPKWGEQGFGPQKSSGLMIGQTVGLSDEYKEKTESMKTFYAQQDKLAKENARSQEQIILQQAKAAKEEERAQKQRAVEKAKADKEEARAQQQIIIQQEKADKESARAEKQAIAEKDRAEKQALRSQRQAMAGMSRGQIMRNFGLDESKLTALETKMREAGVLTGKLGTETKSWASGVANSAVKWAAVGAAIGAAYQIFNQFKKAIENGLVTAGEFQQQMVQLQGTLAVEKFAGVTPEGGVAAANATILNAGTQLAIKYGDNINDVVQNISLWYKATGDLNSAVALSNESLKFQVATGTDLEDTYRTLTALSTQLGGTQIATWDRTRFSLKNTHEVLTMVYDAAAVAGAGMRDVTSSGKAMGEGLNNAAGILLHALDQDAEALKSLGLNVSQIIALNQSLITAMGNTGSEADNVSERMARLVAGFSSLSLNSKATQLAQNIGMPDFAVLQKVLQAQDSSGEKVKNIVGWYEKLNDKQKSQFSYIVASQRGFQTMGNLIQAFLGNYDKILKAEQDKNGLDNVAQQMNETFLQQVKQLQGLWQGVVTIVGRELIPVLGVAIKMMGGFLTEFAVGVSRVAEYTSKESDINNETSFLLHRKEKDSNKVSFSYDTATDEFGQRIMARHQVTAQDKYLNDLRGIIEKRLMAGEIPANAVDRISQALNFTDETQMLHYLYGTFVDSKKDSRTLGNLALPQYASLPISMAASSQAMFSHINDVADWDVAVGAILNSGQGGGGMGVGTPTVKGQKGEKPLTPGAMGAEDLDQVANLYHAYVSNIHDALSADEAYITVLQKKMELFGPTSAGLQQILTLYTDEGKILEKEKVGLNDYESQLNKTAASALRHMASTKANSQEHRKWVDVLDKTRTSLAEVHKEMADRGNKVLENYMAGLDAVNAVAKKYLDSVMKIQDANISAANKDYQSGEGSIQDVVNANIQMANAARGALAYLIPGTQAYTEALQNLHDKGVQAIGDIKDKWDQYNKTVRSQMNEFSGKGLENAFSILGKASVNKDDKDTMEYYRNIVKYQTDLNRLEETYNQDTKEAGGNAYLQNEANKLLDMGTATLDLDAATAQYLSDVQSIVNSGFFQSLDSAISAVGSMASSGITDALFGGNNMRDQIFQYEEITAQIEKQKQWEDLAYQSVRNHTAMEQANHAASIYMLDQQIKKEQQLKKAEEDRLNHPGVLKTFEQTFTKGIVTDLVKQLEQNVESGILKKLMPQQDQQLIAAMRQHVQGLQQNFRVPVQQFDKMINQAFASPIKSDFKSSITKFDQTIKNDLTKAFADFKDQSINPFKDDTNKFVKDGVNPFGNYVKMFKDAVTKLTSQAPGGNNPNGGSGGSSSSHYGLIGAVAGDAVASQISSGLDNSSIMSLMFGNAATGTAPASGGTGTVQTVQLSAPSINDINQAINSSDSTAQMQDAANKAAQALGGDYINNLGQVAVGATSEQIMNQIGGLGGGSMGVLMSLGGGGGILGDITSGVALAGMLGSAGSQSNGGDIIGGSLAGIGITAGLGLTAFAPLFAALGPLGLPALVATIIGGGLAGGALGGLFGPHYSPTTNPDMYGNTGYAQELGNIMGNSGYVQSQHGSTNEDPNLSLALGGSNELQYLDQFVSQHPGGAGLTGAGLQLWQQANQLTQGGTAQGIGGLHQGNVGLTATPGGNSGPYWDYQNWQQLTQTVDNTTNAVQQFQQALQQGSSELIAGFNQFGSGMGFFPYVWSIPGYDYASNPPAGTPGSPGSPGTPKPKPKPPAHHGPQPPPPGSPVGGGPGGGPIGGVRTQVANVYSPDRSGIHQAPVHITSTLNLDGRTVAMSTQSYALQTVRRGYSRLT